MIRMKLLRLSPILLMTLCAVLLCLGVTSVDAENVASMPQPAGYVDDYAGVMTSDGKAQVESICREVHDKTKAQIFFVTIHSLDGESIESFANGLFHNWKIGEKKTDRGVLLLLAVKEHKRRIEVGYGLEGILPDGKAGEIGRDMVPALQVSNYDEAALAGVKEVAAIIGADANVTLDSVGAPPQHFTGDEPPPPVEPAPPTTDFGAGKLVMRIFQFCFFAGFAFIVLMAVLRRRLARRPDGGIGFVTADSGSSIVGGSSSLGSGDGIGFGSDTSSSTSSDSFSGGDGGDSGGGGASGDW